MVLISLCFRIKANSPCLCLAIPFESDGMTGVFGYADDLKLLTPSVHALKILANICEKYAAKYDIIFNRKKSQLIIYKCKRALPPDPGIFINNVKVPRVSELIHLGQCLNDDIYKF